MPVEVASISRRTSSIDEAVRLSMNRPLSSSLLCMLAEAPGRACDIAVGLGVPASTVDRELRLLVAQGLAIRIKDPEGGWYRPMNNDVINAVLAHPPDRILPLQGIH